MARAHPSVAAQELDGHLVLLDSRNGRVFLYDTTAALVWRCLNELSVAAIVEAISRHFDIPAGQVRRDIDGLVDHWRSNALVVDHERNSGVEHGYSPGHVPPACTKSPRWSAEWRCLIRGQVFEFAVEDAGRAQRLRLLFKQLECTGGATDRRFEVREFGGPGAIIAEDGVERVRTDAAEEVPGALYQLILEALHPGIQWRAIIHAGAVALNGAAAAFPAASGSGKTTLVASLIARGFEYLADDFVPVSSPESLVVPWPTPLSIKPGSWSVLAPFHPALEHAPLYPTKGLKARLLDPPDNAWDLGPTPLRCLLFPRYETGAATQLTRLAPVQAFRRLIEDRVWIAYPLTEEKLTEFVQWIRELPAYDLTYGDLSGAAECVRRVIDLAKLGVADR